MYHLIAFVAGFVLDLIFGDPYWLPHPVRFMGALIGRLDKHLLGPKLEEGAKALPGNQASLKVLTEEAIRKRRQGRITLVIVLAVTLLISRGLLSLGYFIHPIAGCVIEALMTYQILAAKCLKVESTKVYDRLQRGTLEEARYAVSMIVGRDTASLDEAGVARAAVETVAENTSDGEIAPMIYLALGGPVFGFLYKAINTMDSMIGYKNDRYIDFGRAAAKLDDWVNYLPARISGLLIIVSCLFMGQSYSARGAARIFARDRYKHASPNSAQTEAACAGALGLRLAGPTAYKGQVLDKPYIGDPTREIEFEDIRRANRLLYASSFMCLFICSGLIGLVLLLA